MHKIFSFHEEVQYDPLALYGYEKIYQNAEKIKNFYSENHRQETLNKQNQSQSLIKFEPFTFHIKIISAQNLDLLNNGIIPNKLIHFYIRKYNIFIKGLPPNCFFDNDNSICKTETFYRLKDPLINYSFTIEMKSFDEVFLNLNLYFRNYNIENKTTLYLDKKIETLKIDLWAIYQYLLQNKIENVTKDHQFSNEKSYITILYSLSKFKETENFTKQNYYPAFKEQKFDLEMENEFLTNELIENFHKTINEINQNVSQPRIFDSPQQKMFATYQDEPNKNFYEDNNQNYEEINEYPSKLEKTLVYI